MTSSPSAPYRHWDDRYAQDGYAYGTEPNDYLKASFDSMKLQPGSNCLLLGEGEGRNAVYLAQQGLYVTAVDISAVGLQKAQALATSKGVMIATVQADLGAYNLGIDQWDCIVGIFCHVPPPIRQRLLEAIPVALRPGGCVLFEGYTPAQLDYNTGGPPKAELMYSSAIFAEAFGDGELKIERNEELVRDVHEGKYHNGKAAVVQFLARKAVSGDSGT